MPIEIEPYDIIIVYGPSSRVKTDPGRMKQIYMSSVLAKSNDKETLVFIYDCNRECEKEYANKYLGKPAEVIGGVACFIL